MSTHDIIRKLVLEEADHRLEVGMPYTARGLANWLIEVHSDEVTGFMASSVEDIMAQQISLVLGEHRARNRRIVSWREDSQVLASESAGRLIYSVSHFGARKEVAQFNREDSLYFSSTQRTRGSTMIALAAWVEYLSKDLKGQAVIADIHDDHAINEAYRRLVGRK